MARLVPLGSVAYNGFVFPVAIKSGIQMHTVDDSAGRTTKYSTYKLHIECIITAADLSGNPPGNPTLTGNQPVTIGMLGLKQALSEKGATLTFTGQGFGDVVANYANCIGFGPSPKVLMWESRGRDLAIHIVWECEFTILACTGSTGNFGELCYSVSFSINKLGYSKRTIQGTAEAFVRRTGPLARRITGNADDLWDLLTFPIPEGFTREVSHEVSADRRILSFSIVDSEVESDQPYPPGIVDVDMSESVSSSMQSEGGLFRWSIHFQGNFTLKTGIPRQLAWTAFLSIIRDRLATNSGKYGNFQYLTFAIDLSEEIFRQQVSFSATYGLLANLSSVIANSGLWRPVPFTWSAWSISVQDVMGGRGIMNLAFNESTDYIVDFCSSSSNPFNASQNKPYTPLPTERDFGSYSCPVGDAGWVRYNNNIHLQTTAGILHNFKLGQNGQLAIRQVAANGADGADLKSRGDFNVSQGSTFNIQFRGAGITYIIMEGECIKIGDRISTIPEITNIGNQNLKTNPLKKFQWALNKRIGYTVEGCSIWQARWYKIYYYPTQSDTDKIFIDGVPPVFQNPGNGQDPANGQGFPAPPNGQNIQLNN